MSSNASSAATWSRGKTGALMLALCFVPAAVNAAAPDFWASLPDILRWSAHALSALFAAVIVWLIVTADYSSHASSAPDESA